MIPKKQKLILVQRQQRAALYVRVSTRYQIDKDSLPFQIKKLKEYLTFLGIHNFEIFQDDGYSGKNTDRPEYQRMMLAMRQGEFTHLIVWKVDRISRNLLDFASMYEELKQRKVTFISLNEQFDTSTAIGEAMLKIILIFAELERKITAERVMGIMIDRAENGLWNGGHVPYGYRLYDEINFPEPDLDGEAEVVKLIFDKYEEYHSSLQVARYLYNHGISGKNGGEWTSKMIHDIIRNPFYIGTYCYNKREAARGELKPEEEWVVKGNNHQGIIEKQQYFNCNLIMDKNAKTRNTAEFRNSEHIHTFSGLLRCASCGSGMQATKDRARENGFRPSVYRCSRRARTLDCNSKTISETILGPFILNYIANMSRVQKNFGKIKALSQLEQQLLLGEEFRDITGIETEGLAITFNALYYQSTNGGRYAPDITVEDDSISDEYDILRSEKEKTEKALKRLMDLYLYDPESITPQEMSEKKKELQSKLSEIESKLELSDVPGNDIADISFIKKTSAFLISQHIVSKKHIDYIDLALKIDNEILKDLFLQLIDYIEVEQGRISAICFTNGLIHRFVYKKYIGTICKVCGGRMGSTVGCRKRTLDYKGKPYRRIKVGDPGDLYEGKKDAICPECGAHYGRWHHYGCAAERCPICGEPYISCPHGSNQDK